MTAFFKNMREDMKDYLKDLMDDLEDLAEDFRNHLYKKPFKRSYKMHRKVKKKIGKHWRPALALAERIRGVLYLIISISILAAAFIAYTDGVIGITEMLIYLIDSWVGRILLFFIGLAYFIYGIWKIIMGSD